MTRKRTLVTIILVICLSLGTVFASAPLPASPTDPLNLLVNAYRKQMSATSLGLQSQVKTTVSGVADGIAAQITADLGIDAAMRKPGEIYLKVALPKVFFPMTPNQAQLELCIKDNTMYTRLPGQQLWEKSDLGQTMPDLAAMDQLIIDEMINLMRNAQIELSSQEVVENGKRYIDITGKVDGEKLYNAIKSRVMELSALYPIDPNELAQFDQMVGPSMKTLQSNFVCRIDAITFEMVKLHSEMSITLDLQQVTPFAVKFGLQTVMDASYLYGDAVQMPVITPEMIAPEAVPEIVP